MTNKLSTFKSTGLFVAILALLALPWESLKADAPEVVGYFQKANWTSRNKLVNQYSIKYDKFNIINYAFFNVNSNGDITTDSPMIDDSLLNGKIDFNQNPPQKVPNTSIIDLAHKNNVKVLLSIGGPGDASDSFSVLASEAATRGNFALNCKNFVKQFNFDGIDIYWDSPSQTDANNLTLLLMAVRDSLYTLTNGLSADKLITLAIGAKPYEINSIQWFAVKNLVYAVNFNAYNFTDESGDSTSHHTPLYSPAKGDKAFSVDSSLRFMLQNYDIPAKKVNLGVSYYGKAILTTGVPELYVPSLKLLDTVSFPNFKGLPPYYDIIAKSSLYDKKFDALTQAPYLTGKLTNKSFVTYDDVYSMGEKASYAISKNLHGITIWDIAADCIENATTPGAYTSPLTDTIVNSMRESRFYITGLSAQSVCPGSLITVMFKTTSAASGNTFRVLLSDSLGSFVNPTASSDIQVGSENYFYFFVPRNLVASNKYQLKVIPTGTGFFRFMPFNNTLNVLANVNLVIAGANTSCINDVKTYKVKTAVSGLNWTAVGGTIMSAAADSVVVKWTASATNRIIAKASNGVCQDSVALNVASNSVVKPVIEGVLKACTGDLVGFKAGANTDANCVWYTENGIVIPGQFNPAVAVVKWTKAGTNKLTLVQYYGTNCIDSTSISVNVVDKSSAAITRTIKDTVVMGSTYVLKSGKNAGDVYKWTTNNVQNNNPLTVDSLSVTFNKEGVASVGLKVTNSSGCVDSTGFSVVVIKLAAAAITGPAYTQLNETHTYSIPAENNCSYAWTIDPNYGTLIGNPQSNSIQVKWNKFGEGYVKVIKSHKTTDWTSTATLQVTCETTDYALILGPEKACVGTTVEYKIKSSKYDKFTWSFGDYGSIYGSGVGSTVKVDWIKAGFVTVRVTLESSKSPGQSQTTTFIEVSQLPIKPTLKLESGKIVCTTTANIMIDWYLDGKLISANGAYELIPAKTGNYMAIARNLAGCADSSAKLFVDMTGVNDGVENDAIQISPNPNSGSFEVKGQDIISLELYNAVGSFVKSFENNSNSNLSLNVQDMPTGAYYLKVITAKGVSIKEISIVK